MTMRNRNDEECDMATDIIYGGRVSEIDGAMAEGDNLWLSNASLKGKRMGTEARRCVHGRHVHSDSAGARD